MRELPVVRRQWKRADDKLTEMPVTTTFFLLPETPGQGRERDRRIGFSSVSYDYFKDECTGIRTRHLIRRWALEPKDVAAYLTGKLTEPREPIVFYLDPMIPERWKPYFVQAVEDWQRAFEVAGFRNAIVTRDIPEETGQSFSVVEGIDSLPRFFAKRGGGRECRPPKRSNHTGSCALGSRSVGFVEIRVGYEKCFVADRT